MQRFLSDKKVLFFDKNAWKEATCIFQEDAAILSRFLNPRCFLRDFFKAFDKLLNSKYLASMLSYKL